MRNKRQRPTCIECGRELPTLRDNIIISGAPVLCRKCFGEQSYKGGSRWYSNIPVPEALALEQAA